MANAIEASGLRKHFGPTKALDGLDLTVRTGEVHAFLGPNGAGKTTTIRILLGLLRKDGGEVSSSHILAEAEALADRVTIIRAGQTVETGTLADMRHLTRTTVDAELAGPLDLDGMPGIHNAVLDGARLRCEVDNAALTDVLRRLSAVGVRTLTCRPPTLEELFLRHYSERTVAALQP